MEQGRRHLPSSKIGRELAGFGVECHLVEHQQPQDRGERDDCQYGDGGVSQFHERSPAGQDGVDGDCNRQHDEANELVLEVVEDRQDDVHGCVCRLAVGI